MLSFKYYCLY